MIFTNPGAAVKIRAMPLILSVPNYNIESRKNSLSMMSSANPLP
jgi:hypothetical protein